MNIERIDTWVIRAAIAVPVVCVTGVALWHLVGYLARKMARPRVARLSPEPPDAFRSNQAAETDPEQLERACANQAEVLAELYLKLAESWLSQGQPQRATAALQKLLERCPDTRQAKLARDRLQQITTVEK
jgi:hypothetical protein